MNGRFYVNIVIAVCKDTDGGSSLTAPEVEVVTARSRKGMRLESMMRTAKCLCICIYLLKHPATHAVSVARNSPCVHSQLNDVWCEAFRDHLAGCADQGGFIRLRDILVYSRSSNETSFPLNI